VRAGLSIIVLGGERSRSGAAEVRSVASRRPRHRREESSERGAGRRRRGGKVAAIAERIDPADALKTVDVSGLYVTPGLVDIHTHVYAGTGEKGPTRATTASTRMDSRSDPA
jgi:cytosine/adenosine deaminase-related metal-dependent hydrolase